MTELEKKFRKGESTGRPLGGNISPEPFPHALYNLAVSRGYESQKALAKDLGIRCSTIGTWYRGEMTPNPKYLGEILVLLRPNDEESDSLLNPYGQLLEKRPIKYSLIKRKPRSSPFDKWVEEYCIEHATTINSLTRLLGFKNSVPIRPMKQEIGLGLNVFSQILQNGPQALNLSPEETDTLSEAVATTIEKQMAAGHRFRGNHHLLARKLQAELTCITYTPAQAAHELGITREGVRYLRNKFGLPLLLTKTHLEMLKNR